MATSDRGCGWEDYSTPTLLSDGKRASGVRNVVITRRHHTHFHHLCGYAHPTYLSCVVTARRTAVGQYVARQVRLLPTSTPSLPPRLAARKGEGAHACVFAHLYAVKIDLCCVKRPSSYRKYVFGRLPCLNKPIMVDLTAYKHTVPQGMDFSIISRKRKARRTGGTLAERLRKRTEKTSLWWVKTQA